jgi:hypothetical protein
MYSNYVRLESSESVYLDVERVGMGNSVSIFGHDNGPELPPDLVVPRYWGSPKRSTGKCEVTHTSSDPQDRQRMPEREPGEPAIVPAMVVIRNRRLHHASVSWQHENRTIQSARWVGEPSSSQSGDSQAIVSLSALCDPWRILEPESGLCVIGSPVLSRLGFSRS